MPFGLEGSVSFSVQQFRVAVCVSRSVKVLSAAVQFGFDGSGKSFSVKQFGVAIPFWWKRENFSVK